MKINLQNKLPLLSEQNKVSGNRSDSLTSALSVSAAVVGEAISREQTRNLSKKRTE